MLWDINAKWLEDSLHVLVSDHLSSLKFREDELVVDVNLERTCLEQTSLELTPEEESSKTVHPRAFLHAFDGLGHGSSKSCEYFISKPD